MGNRHLPVWGGNNESQRGRVKKRWALSFQGVNTRMPLLTLSPWAVLCKASLSSRDPQYSGASHSALILPLEVLGLFYHNSLQSSNPSAHTFNSNDTTRSHSSLNTWLLLGPQKSKASTGLRLHGTRTALRNLLFP